MTQMQRAGDPNNDVTFQKNVSVAGTLAVTGAATLSSTLTGQLATVHASAGATETLTAAQSGSTVLFDRASGVTYTLPAPAVGLYYDFVVSTTVTSNNHKVITDAGTTFIFGGLAVGEAAGTTTLNALGNGTTHVAITQNGTTTGGILGSQFRLTCINSTQWQVSGIVNGSGTLATPFATS